MSWRVWRKFLEIVDPVKHTVYAIDITGFGDSDKPEMKYSIGNLTNSFIEFIEALSLHRPIIGGHSMGVTLCLEAVTGKKLDVSGLIIADSGSRSAHRTSDLIRRLETTNDKRSDIRSIIETFFLDIREKDLDEFTSDAMKGTDESLIGSLNGILDFNYDPYLPMLKMPVIIFYGEHDRNRGIEEAKHLNESIPGSELIVISNAAHCPMFEQPRIFNEFFEKWEAQYVDSDTVGSARLP